MDNRHLVDRMTGAAHRRHRCRRRATEPRPRQTRLPPSERWPSRPEPSVEAYRRALALVEEGRAWLEQLLGGGGAPAAPGWAAPAVALSDREREVASLIARGKTSREIADELVISVRTADTHASHIRDKLDLHSRAEIAAWAVRHGLLRDRAA